MSGHDDGKRDINRIELRGRLGRDPEVRSSQSGQQFVSFSIATEERWKDRQSGEWTGLTQWHRATVKFNDALVNIALDLHKGDRVRLVGKMVYREWEKDGVKRTTAEIEVSRFGELELVPDDRAPAARQAARPAQRPAPRQPGGGSFDLEDEIPFAVCWQ